MTQQIQSPGTHSGGPIEALFGSSSADRGRLVDLLDEAIPLEGASHAEVVEYRVETPIRYAECKALLADGRKVGLQMPRQFVGWSKNAPTRSLLFRSGGKHLEVAVEEHLRGQAPGCINEVRLEAQSERRSSLARKFIGTDGDLVILPDSPSDS